GEPDRLRARHPGGRLVLLRAALAIVMCVFPPAAQVLAAEHPWLATGSIRNGCADARLAISFAGIVPVIALAACNGAAHRHDIMRACSAIRIAARMILVTPVGEREIIVDADCVD